MTTAKRRMMWSAVTGVLLLAAWVVPVGAQADGPSHGRGPRGGWGGGLMLGVPLHTLNLTPDQRTQAQSILSTYRSSAGPIIQQLRQTQSGLGDRTRRAAVRGENRLRL